MAQKSTEGALQTAYEIAARHNMFLVPQGNEYLLYRRTKTRPMFLGKRSDEVSLRSLVKRCASIK